MGIAAALLGAAVATAWEPEGASKDDSKTKKVSHKPKAKAKKLTAKMPALDFTMKDIDGKDVKLSKYYGNVILMVNTASKCGYTPQYEGLEKLYERNKDKGFVILGFPANEFGGQEPGTNEQIKEFCTSKYSVTFPMFEKVCVKGGMICPLYKYLTDEKADHKLGGEIKWNFNKFLINRQGEVVARYDSATAPESPKLYKAIRKELKAEVPPGSTVKIKKKTPKKADKK